MWNVSEITICGVCNLTNASRTSYDGDNDAVLDDVDECPTTPEGEPVYSTGCSDSETDDDDDNVMNDRDQCPLTPSGNQWIIMGVQIVRRMMIWMV